MFEHPTGGIDLDDFEILNGANEASLGSFPDIYLLTSEGELANQSAWPTGKVERLRVLFVYQVPADIASVKLRYWGEDVVPQAVPISGTGPAVEKR